MYCTIGIKYIHGFLKIINEQIPGIKENRDIEFIHKTRTSSRRILTALKTFKPCFAEADFILYFNCTRQLARNLGEARDLDVHQIYLSEISSQLNSWSNKRGIERLILRMMQKRKDIQNETIQIIETFSQKKIMEDFENKYMNQYTNEVNITNQKNYFSEYFDKRINNITKYESFLNKENNVSELHEMRKAFKKLRYTLEIFNSNLNIELKNEIDLTIKIQTLLGKIHDNDVWLELLPKYLQREERKTLEYFGTKEPINILLPGIKFLELKMNKERLENQKLLIEEWNIMIKDNFLQKLLKIKNKISDFLFWENLHLSPEMHSGSN